MLVIFQQLNNNSQSSSAHKILQFVKIGSACLFDDSGKINYKILKQKAREIEANEDYNVLIVSGAIALGMAKEKESRTKEQLTSVELQGYASLGQIELMSIYKKLFTKEIAQLLVTETELSQKNHIKALILENLRKNRITLINYNDCIDFEELRKDNDTLAADIMLACNGDRLIILGNDYEGFRDSQGNLIRRVKALEDWMYDCCNGKSKQGNGGFKTKLDAAKKIIDNDKEMIVSNIAHNFEDIIQGKANRTLFKK